MVENVALYKGRDILTVVSNNIPHYPHSQFSDGLALSLYGCYDVLFESLFLDYVLGDLLLDCESELEECFEGQFFLVDDEREQPFVGNFAVVDMVDQNPELSWIFADNVQNLLFFSDDLVACCDDSHLPDVAGVGRQVLG